MSSDEILTDEYVANLLVEEAREGSSSQSRTGMDAFRLNKKPANKLKPNTRFLRKIIRSTDHHNRALLARETAESNAKLKGLERAEEIKRLRANPNPSDIRRRQMGDIHAILGGTKRTRRGEGDDGDGARALRSRDKEKSKQPRDEERRKRADDLSRNDQHHKKRHGDKEERRSSRRTRDHGDHGGRSQSRRHARSRSPREEKEKHRQRSRHRSRSRDALVSVGQAADGGRDSDSDSSGDAIGPAPPPTRYRGRGRIGGAASLDRRFSESYDPKTDGVDMDSCDADDAENREEAFRDRLKLMQIQQQRMKRAGFTEDEIRKSRYGIDKTEREVVWTKAGEKRAWDQGKAEDAGEGEGEPSTVRF